MNPGELHNPSSEEETLMTCNTMTSWVIKKEKDHQKRRTRNTKKIWEKEEDPALAFFCASYFDSFWEDEHDATYQDENAIFAYTSFALYKVQLEYKKFQTPQFP